jgi:hypothetical protein
MLNPLPVTMLAALGTLAFPQSPVSPAHAAGYLNQCIAVEGVAHVHEDQQRSGMDVDLVGGNATFRSFIPKGNLRQFPGLNDTEGKSVVITGFVRIAYSRPEMVLFDASQLMSAKLPAATPLRCPAAL